MESLIQPWERDYIDEPEGDMFTMPPRIVYRYLSVKRAQQILAQKKLWFASPNSFNDPFDMYHRLIDFTVNKQRAKEFANRARSGQPRAIRRAFAKDVVKRQQDLINHQIGLFNETKANSGVCCFSEHADVTLMWSHYADSHRGVVIGFNIIPARVEADLFFFLQPVRYKPEVKAENFYDGKERTLMHWVLTKSAIWQYEAEIRAFYLNKNGLIDFDPKCIKEIYFGCNSSKEDIDGIMAVIKEQGYQDIAFNKMEINPRTFNIKSKKYRNDLLT